MSIEETRQVVEAFVETSEGYWLAETVQLSSPTRVVASGRDAVRVALEHLHAPDADDDHATQTRVVVGDGIAAVEIRPWPGGQRGRDSEPPEGRRNARSAACFYEVAGGEIVRASVYIDTTTIDTTPATGTNAPCERRTDR